MPGSVSTVKTDRLFNLASFPDQRVRMRKWGAPFAVGRFSSLRAAAVTASAEGFPRLWASVAAVSLVKSKTRRLPARYVSPFDVTSLDKIMGKFAVKKKNRGGYIVNRKYSNI